MNFDMSLLRGEVTVAAVNLLVALLSIHADAVSLLSTAFCYSGAFGCHAAMLYAVVSYQASGVCCFLLRGYQHCVLGTAYAVASYPLSHSSSGACLLLERASAKT
eukprot:GHUV01030387.1.p2 GENE.GHUV01030387.1~~GHUV01030387.1.p2  ORF type:complete len:105 (-),score=7.41 GHUV01030387.1:320-634(-)